MNKINIGLIGFGNVGSGVIKILRDKKLLLCEKTGVEINIKKICDKDISSRRGVSVERNLLTRSPEEIIDDPQIDIVVELIGGIHPAKEFITAALKSGKHVVTPIRRYLPRKEESSLPWRATGQKIFILRLRLARASRLSRRYAKDW